MGINAEAANSVYFVKPVDADGPIKIGCSQEPEARLHAMDKMSPVRLEIAAQLPGGTILERRFHHRFRHLHSHGEWFRADDELIETVRAIKEGNFDTGTLPEPKGVIHIARAYLRSQPEGAV